MNWTDTHAHLADESLLNQLDSVLERASAVGVSRILCVAVDAATSQKAVEIAEKYPQVWATAGIHPNYAHQASDRDWSSIREITSHPKVVALGETGLDKYWDDCPFELQQRNFARHWDLSRETRLPVVVHMRNCEPEMLSALRLELDRNERMSEGPLRGVMHSFAGSASMLAECQQFGMYISFAGMLTYKKSKELRDTASQASVDRLLVETDSPYLSPEPHRGKRPNEPANIVHTAKCLAQACGVSLGELSDRTQKNCRQLFWKLA